MMEPMDIVGKAKEDASLPKATMTKIIKEMLPPDVRVARDAQDLLIECCVVGVGYHASKLHFTVYLWSEAPSFAVSKVLGFGEYIEDVYAAYEQHKVETMVILLFQVNFKDCTDPGGLSGLWGNAAEMTEEEAAAEQQRMFAEARARMNGNVPLPKSDTDPTPES
uniref:Transcription factor CBF/NF-Y/archaeal histone domain-containing protein n=1 Tax=Chenopodium quinoa TaxID=63459 RepID=A0A803MF25_CHEQI